MTQFKVEIWQGGSGNYYVASTQALGKNSGAWYATAKACNLTPHDFVVWLLKVHQPDDVSWNGKNLTYSWNKDNYVKANKFKNEVNKLARSCAFRI